MSYSAITESYISTLELEDRKAKGQYMTPALIADRLSQALSPKGEVLDPAVGTGELLLSVDRGKNNLSLSGFDVEPGMVETARKNIPHANLYQISLFSDEWRDHVGMYDSIIANPPYFEIKKDDVRLNYVKDFYLVKNAKGRLNIYSLFFEYSLNLLKAGGRMAFLVPPSMNNGRYFSPLRELILESGYVKSLEILRENKLFSDALTSTQIIVIQKTDDGYEKNANRSHDFLFGEPHNYVFTDNRDFLVDKWKGKKSLKEHGMKVTTGSVVWNQHKEGFVTQHDGIPLYYAKDISTSHSVVLSGKIPDDRRWLELTEKTSKKILTGPSILVNRIVGSLSNPQIRFAFVDEEKYFVENHVNVIRGENIEQVFNKMTALPPADLISYLQALTGNTQLSARELENMIPL